jgi:hypothetical protein
VQRDAISSRKAKEKDKFDVVRTFNVGVNVCDVSHGNSGFLGAAFDTGAERSVIGMQQALCYCRMASKQLEFIPSNRVFRFGDETCTSSGSFEISIPTPDGCLQASVDVVKPDIPLLIGLDLMDKHRLQFLSVSDELEHSPASGKGWKIPVTRKHGHGYLVWSSSAVHYTRPQLQKLHQHFYHPSTSKLMNVLKRASPESVTKETKTLLDDIVQACQACQVYSSSPLH